MALDSVSFCVSDVVAPVAVCARRALGAACGATVRVIAGISWPTAVPPKLTRTLPLAASSATAAVAPVEPKLTPAAVVALSSAALIAAVLALKSMAAVM